MDPEKSDANTSPVPRVRSYKPLKIWDYVNPQEDTTVSTTDLKLYEEMMAEEAMKEQLLSGLPYYDEEYSMTDSDLDELIINNQYDDEYLEDIYPYTHDEYLDGIYGYTKPPSPSVRFAENELLCKLRESTTTQTVKTKCTKPKTNWMKRMVETPTDENA